MKKALILLIFASLSIFNADAQKKVPDTHKTNNEQKYRRTEIVLPVVKGLNCYKADLHVHTIYSDGEVTPRQRVREGERYIYKDRLRCYGRGILSAIL